VKLKIAFLLAFNSFFLAPAATVGDTDRFIPLIHDGGGWRTQITIINLSEKDETVLAEFMTTRGFLERWKIGLNASPGKVNNSAVEMLLAPGAVATIETSGTPSDLARGFAEITESRDLPFGAIARLTKQENGAIVESFTVPLSPAHESRSKLAVDLTNPAALLEIIWVSPTNSTTLDINFRDTNGAILFKDTLTFDAGVQLFLKVAEVWPKIVGLRGTLEWKVSFPNADRYEYRFLSSVAIYRPEGQTPFAVPAMTLKPDQLKISPY
jgi:hypothetical protein